MTINWQTLVSFVQGILGQLKSLPTAPQQAPQAVQPSLGYSVASKPIPSSVPSLKSAWTVAQMTVEIMKNEGGFVDDPSDSGGATNFGISLNFAKGHPAFFDVDGDGAVTVADIKALTPAKATEAYIDFFYTPARLGQLPNVSNLIMQLFDCAVNMGVNMADGETEAVKILQHAIGTTADGEIGPTTVASTLRYVALHGATTLNNAVVDARKNFYTEVVAAHPQDAKFLKGWDARAEKYRA